jgi:hypothetical protein
VELEKLLACLKEKLEKVQIDYLNTTIIWCFRCYKNNRFDLWKCWKLKKRRSRWSVYYKGANAIFLYTKYSSLIL